MSPLILAVVAVFGTVALLVGVVAAYIAEAAPPARRRLERVGQVQASGVLLETSQSLTPESSVFVKRMTTFVPRSPKDVSRLRKRFMRAGYYTLTPLGVYSLTTSKGRTDRVGCMPPA